MRAPDRDAATVGMIDTSGKQFVFILLAEVGLKVLRAPGCPCSKGQSPSHCPIALWVQIPTFPKSSKRQLLPRLSLPHR